MKRRSILAGELLVMKDDSSKEIFFVEKGKFRAYLYGLDGKLAIGEILPGELIGELSFITDSARSASVEAVEDSEVLCIDPTEFDNIYHEQHPWVRALVYSLSNRVKLLNHKLEELSH